ncbi:MAG: radical SAM protein [Elusimicrobiales bacterium]
MRRAPLPGAKKPEDSFMKSLFAEVDRLMLPEMPPNYPPMMLYDGRVNSVKTAELLAGWRSSLKECPAPPVVYVHVPFCQQICDFCGFYRKKLDSPGEADAFLDQLSDEASLFSDIFKKTPLRFLCIGGGTPSMLTAGQLARLFGILRTNFVVEKNTRIAFEASPMTLNREKLKLLKAEGVNFLAIGVQSLNDRLMASFSRRQSREKVLEVIRQAKEIGVENVEVDLMVGLAGEDPRDLLRDARTIGALDLERIYIFDYQPKYKTLDASQRSSLPAAEIAQARKFRRQAMDHLLANGYNMRCGHWVYKRDGDKWPYSYDQQEDGGYSILGLGPSSVSYAMGRLRYENISDTGEYSRLTAAGRLPVLRGRFLTEREELINKVLLDLLHRGEVSRTELRGRFSPAEVRFAEGRFKNLKAAGVLVGNSGALALVNRERGVFELRKEFFEVKAISELSRLTGISPLAAAPVAEKEAPAGDLLLSRGDKSVKELLLTEDCGLACSFCRHAGRRGGAREFGELTRELLLLSKRGVRELILTGGEPLLHPRFGELLRLAGKLRFKKLSLFTSGNAGTENPGFCEELRREGLDAVYLSLHSHREKVHNGLTSGDNYAKALGSAENMAAAGIELNLVTLLRGENLAGVPDQLRFFRRKFGDINFHLVFPRRQKRGAGAVRYLDADGLYAKLAAEDGLRGVKFYNVPPCRTGQDAAVTGDLIKGYKGDGRESALNADMVKLTECNLCKYLLVCPGPGPDYLAVFGGGEITAIKNMDTPAAPRRPAAPRPRGKMR